MGELSLTKVLLDEVIYFANEIKASKTELETKVLMAFRDKYGAKYLLAGGDPMELYLALQGTD